MRHTMEFLETRPAGDEEVEQGGEGMAKPTAPPARLPRPAQRRDRKTHGSAQRRAGSIHAYIGANGSGKSLAMVHDTLPTLAGIKWHCENESHRHTKHGITDGYRRVLSTVQLLDAETGQPHPLYERLTEWSQLLEAEHCDVLFDEVTGIAGSREAMGMPVVVQNLLNQLRRRDILLRWSAPAWARADTVIRSCTIQVTVSKGFFPDHAATRGDQPAQWAPKRLFKWRTFAAEDFDEWTAAKASQDKNARSALRAKRVAWFWGPGSLAFASYDTYDSVTRVGEVLDGGRCAHCGGRRQAPVCKCDH